MPNDTYIAGSGSNRAVEYAYNPKTGIWEPVTSQSPSQSSTGNSSSTDKQNSGSYTLDSSSKVNSKAQADSEYIEIEFNTLEGELTLVPNAKTLTIKSGDTIYVEGVGKYLSGLYYVSAVNKVLDSQGFSLVLTVIKTGFGSSLKNVQVNYTDSSTTTRPAQVTPKAPTFQEGDRVMFLTVEAKKYTYSNSDEGKYVPKWVTEKVHTIDGVSSDGARVRLKEIWSWTYVKFLKKV